jgi:hypothetical protein
MSSDRGDREYKKFRDAGGDNLSKVAVQIEGSDSTIIVETEGASTATVTSVTVTTTSTQLLASNADRKMAMFHNDGGGLIWLKLGTTASATSFTARLNANDYYELPLPIYTGIIHAIANTGTRDVRITEY